MTTPTFHDRMMNIPIPDHFNSAEDRDAGLRVTYKFGHRDARHAAAEIACEADRELKRLSQLVDEERRTVSKIGLLRDEANEERDTLRQMVSDLRQRLDGAGIAALRDDAPGPDRERFAKAINEARARLAGGIDRVLVHHWGGEWIGWSCAVPTGSQEVSSPGWYPLPPGQWPGEPCIIIERVERDGMELPTVAEAMDSWGVPAKVAE